MRRLWLGAALALAAGMISAPSYATVWTVASGNVGSFPDDNVINNACVGNITGPARALLGFGLIRRRRRR